MAKATNTTRTRDELVSAYLEKHGSVDPNLTDEQLAAADDDDNTTAEEETPPPAPVKKTKAKKAKATPQPEPEPEDDTQESETEERAPVVNTAQAAFVSRKNRIKAKLEKEPKVTIIIPMETGEKSGAYQSVTINGYRMEVKKGIQVPVPKSVANLILQRLESKRKILSESAFNLDARREKGEKIDEVFG